MQIVAPSPEGLEKLLAKEIGDLGGSNIKVFKRFISFSCDNATFYRIHFFSRIAFRFYRQISTFLCNDKYDLYKGVQSSLNWLRWIPTDKSFCVKVTGKNLNLRHSHFTALQVKNAIVDMQTETFGERSNISLDCPYLIINLHLYNNEATLSLQSTLDSLHKRGYRPAMGHAPIKENLASGLIQLTGWDGRKPLIDLMCGSCTFLIEGLSYLFNTPYISEESYLFENWIDFDKNVFLNEKSKIIKNSSYKKNLPKLIGCDSDKRIIAQAKDNIALAGYTNLIDLKNCDFSEINTNELQEIGLLLCNPPYGKKLGNESDLINLYTRLGQFVKEKFSKWEFWLLSGNPELTKYLKMKSSLKIPISNGGIDCRWIKYLIK